MTKSSKRVHSKRRPVQRSSPRWQAWGLVVLVAIIAALVIYAAYASFTSSGGVAGVQLFGSPARGHEQGPLTYETTPPVGGIHNPTWQNCGIYDQPVANENAVHSMEHGAVWITYSLDLATDAIDQLRTAAQGRSHVLLSPFEGLPSPVVLSAWGVQLRLDEASDERLRQFIGEYEQGLQTPELGATCAGGVGEPVG